MHPKRTPEQGFWKYVTPGPFTDCWEWTGSIMTQGYGRLRHHNKTYRAHRISYELHNGPIPDDMDVLHKCDNPPCCNPAHLFLGTQADNNADRDKKGRHVPHPGEQHWNAKITESDVIEIRRLHREGMTQAEISRRYKLNHSTIFDIVKRRKWRHVP